MKKWLTPVFSSLALALGIYGIASEVEPFYQYRLWLIIPAALLLFRAAMMVFHVPLEKKWDYKTKEPQPFPRSWTDYPKILWSWLNAYNRTFAVEPGLYYTGDEYDVNAPLLVTSNYHMTAFLVARRARSFNARLLVIDTDSINVWCSAGKGRFSNERILEQLKRYDKKYYDDGKKKLTLILPKFGLSGIDIQKLREYAIRPVIGPLYARQIPEYLANPPYKDQDNAKANFDVQMRTFAWLPGLVQTLTTSLTIVFALLILELIWGFKVPLGIVLLTAAIATAYPLLFPYIPGTRFSVKGIWLAVVLAVVLTALYFAGILAVHQAILGVLYGFATSIFFALSFTGNSAVSNYTRVRKEIARFLPVSVVFYVASLAVFVVLEVIK